jgi:hypothetical protein
VPRKLRVGAVQLGPIARAESRRDVVVRLLALMREASASGCDLDAGRAAARQAGGLTTQPSYRPPGAVQIVLPIRW